jgi:hypothetical protein
VCDRLEALLMAAFCAEAARRAGQGSVPLLRLHLIRSYGVLAPNVSEANMRNRIFEIDVAPADFRVPMTEIGSVDEMSAPKTRRHARFLCIPRDAYRMLQRRWILSSGSQGRVS